MKPEHFTNNANTIEINSVYVVPKATKLETARNIAGVSFDGSGTIDIPYFNLIHKIGVGSGLSITTGSATTSPNITLSLTEIEIPNLGTGKITSGTFDIARIPDMQLLRLHRGHLI